MFKASCDLSSEILPALEDYLYEIAPSSWFIVEDEIKGQSQLIGYFTCKDNAISEISSLNEFSISETDFQFDELADRDWKESYKAHFSPLPIFGERKERLNSMKLEFSKSSSDNCFFESYRVSKNDNKSSIEIFAKSNLQITADFSYVCLFNNSSS